MGKIHKIEIWGKLACGRKITKTIKKVDYMEFQKVIRGRLEEVCSQCYWSGWTR